MDFLNWISAVADAGEKAAKAATDTKSPGPDFSTFLPVMALIFVAFYFLIDRPRRRQEKERAAKLSAVSKGDRVITIGGIHGTVEGVSEDKGTVTLTVAPKISMKFNKSAIASIESRKGEKQEEEAK